MVVIPVALKPYADQERWVVWRLIKKKGAKKATKIPYQPLKPSVTAASNNSSTWADAATAIKAAEDGNFNGIGICLLNSNIVALDVDDCRDPKTGEIDPYVVKLSERAKTYCEITPSKTGLRIIGIGSGAKIYKGKLKVPGSNGATIETYRNCERYITVTGDALPNAPSTLADIDLLVDAVVEELGATKQKKSDGAAKSKTNSSKGELPASLTTRLFIPDLGVNVPHAGYATRSELLIAFIFDALRARVSTETIVEACLDEDHKGHAIYEHCVGNGGRDYVLRQIEHALTKIKEGLDVAVANINKSHALVLAGDKAAIMKFEEGPFRLITVAGFRQWFANQQITVGNRVTSIGDYWLTHPQRRQYEGIEFDPGSGRPGYYNMFTGFGVEPRAGDCSKFLTHVLENVAQNNKDHYDWIIGFFAQIFQQPKEKPGTALCLRGKMGVGKTIVGQIIGNLLPGYYQLVSDPRYIVGQFNSHMAQCLLLHADEAFWAGAKSGEGKLKDLVTGDYHLLEYKHVDPIRV